MSTFGCNVDNLLPASDNIIKNLSSITHSFSNLLDAVYSKMTQPFAQYSLETYVKQSEAIQRQLLSSAPFGKSDFNSRLNLRLMLGLSPEFKEDTKAIEQLCGSISWITKDKVDVVSMLRTMRDNE